MQCFIGLVPPPASSEAIYTLQKQFCDNRTEPHITLRPPVSVADTGAWKQAIKLTAQSFSPFPITLSKTGMFGKRVLYIEAEGDQLYDLEKTLIPAIKSFEQENKYKDQPYHAHLTLGRLNVGFTPAALQKMRKLADEMLIEPIKFSASFIRVYYKPSITERYKVLEDFYFSS